MYANRNSISDTCRKQTEQYEHQSDLGIKRFLLYSQLMGHKLSKPVGGRIQSMVCGFDPHGIVTTFDESARFATYNSN